MSEVANILQLGTEKLSSGGLSVAQSFRGSVSWNGSYCLALNGEYGEEFHQIVYWRNFLVLPENKAIDLWLEYKKDPGVEIMLKITQFKPDTISELQKVQLFSETDMKCPVTLEAQAVPVPVFISLLAKGAGKLEIIALHDRDSFDGQNVFLPGGKRYVTSDREEIFYLFDPGDCRPPLNVYFSGYKTTQGFEGYAMMKATGAPFLLLADPRLEGGCCYLGSEEYEKALTGIITTHMEQLGFSGDQVILSGISMGSFGALYYGCDILPHAMLLAKPMVNLGDVAENERLHRPGGFPASLDVLNYLTGGLSSEDVTKLNVRFWDKFDGADWKYSKFVVSYMLEDDYDSRAYESLLSHLKTTGVRLYGKGIHGRHNDATGEITGWFKNQYKEILQRDFGRKVINE